MASHSQATPFQDGPVPDSQPISVPSKTKSSLAPKSRAKVVTMKDIAQVAGVTSMTVSRVMKGDGYVAPATRELVLRIAQELNYTMNLAGRALRTGRTGTIGVITGSLTQPYNASIVSTLESLFKSSGYQIKFVFNEGDLGSLIDSTQASVVDGVIIAGMHNLVDHFRESGHQITQPYVHISITKVDDEDCVQCDLAPAVEEALQTMLDAGRSRIAYIGVGSPDHFTVADREIRTRSYVSMMRRGGRSPELISSSDSYQVGGQERVETLKRYFGQHGCPDALLCVNDEVMMQTYRALMDMSYSIPQDTLLVGCDGLPSTAYFEPPLSTIAQPLEAICATAWKFLQTRIADPETPTQHACFEAKLVARRSLLP